MKKIIIISVLVIVVLATGVAAFVFIKKPSGSQTYQFAKITKGDIRNVITCTGSLEFTYSGNVPALVSGVVNKVFVDFNQKVAKGQVLATLDDTFLKLALDSSKTALDKALFQYRKAEKDLNDTKILYDKNFKSKSGLETAQDNFESTKTAYKTAQVEAEKAEINLRYARIEAPVSGIIIEKNIDTGDTVSAGSATPVFVIASDTSKMQALASVDENDISSVKPGQAVSFSVQAFQDKKFDGKVVQIRLKPTVVQNVVNYTVVVDVVNKDGHLLPGMTATMEIIVEQKSNVLRVPVAVLKFTPTQEMFREAFGTGDHGGSNRGQWQGNNSGWNRNQQNNRKDAALLWVLDETTGKVKPERVKLGATDNQYTEVTADTIKEGEQVVSGFASGNSSGQSRGNNSQGRNPFQTRGGGPGPWH
jgi:HlyD family secretion protein